MPRKGLRYCHVILHLGFACSGGEKERKQPPPVVCAQHREKRHCKYFQDINTAGRSRHFSGVEIKMFALPERVTANNHMLVIMMPLFL